jgi:ubiquitin-conjugating enzyme E2 H
VSHLIFPARSRAKKKLRRPEEYKKKVAEYVKKYATEEALRDQCGGEQDDLSSSSESSMSDFSEDEAKDMEL